MRPSITVPSIVGAFLLLTCAEILGASFEGLSTALPRSGAILLPKSPNDLLDLSKLQMAYKAGSGMNDIVVTVPSIPREGAGLPDTVILPSDRLRTPLNLISVQAEQLSNRAQALAIRIQRESAAPSALSDLRSKFTAKSVPTLTIDARDVDAIAQVSGSMAVLKSVTLSPTSGTLAGNAAFAAALERANLQGLRLNEDQLQALPSIARVTAAGRQHAAIRSMAPEYFAVIESVARLLDEPTNADTLATAKMQVASVNDSLARNWRALSKNQAAREQAVSTIDALNTQSEFKTIYGVETNFDPPSYAQIFDYSQRAVGIEDRGAIICSGIAIDDLWVMTAGHCLTGRNPTQMKVVFGLDAAGRRTKKINILDHWPNPAPGANPQDTIDYAFVRYASDSTIASLLTSLDNQISGDAAAANGDLRPFCIRTTPLAYKEPVFVIAQRGDNRKVHDYAYVWFPFKLSSSELDTVAWETEIGLHRAAQIMRADAAREQKYVSDGMDNFISSYVRIERPDLITYEYRSKKGGSQTARPYFGIDSDTFHGNSGGAVFSRTDTCIVGIFVGGQPDYLVANSISWREHEFATPISEVIDDIRKATAGLASNNTPPNPNAGDSAAQATVARAKLLETLKRLEDNQNTR